MNKLATESAEKKFEFHSTELSIRSRHDLSRIDAYGDQPKCLSSIVSNALLNLNIRKFCFGNPNLYTINTTRTTLIK